MAAPHGHGDVYGNIRSLSGGNVVGMATNYLGRMVSVSDHDRGKRSFCVIPGLCCDVPEIFLLSKSSRPALGHTHFHIQRVPEFFPRSKAAGLGS
jgi:hypothetical protein